MWGAPDMWGAPPHTRRGKARLCCLEEAGDEGCDSLACEPLSLQDVLSQNPAHHLTSPSIPHLESSNRA